MLPSTDELLRRFGDRLRLARLRRLLSAKQVAERAGMSPMTLRSLERGGSGVTIGAYLTVMQVLGIENDLDLLGKADPAGRELQDARLPAHGRTKQTLAIQIRKTLSSTASAQLRETAARSEAHARKTRKSPKASGATKEWVQQGGFASAETLTGLIDPLASAPKKR